MREWIEKQLRFFRDQVEGLDIAEDIKKVVPSRCQISDKQVKFSVARVKFELKT